MASNKLCKEFKKLRVDAEINRAQMAKAIGMTEKRLADIEIGRLEITRKEIAAIAEHFGADELVLTNAAVASTNSITFDLTGLTDIQRYRVFDLKANLDEENAAAIEAAAIKAKELKEAKKAERQAKKQIPNVSVNSVVFDSESDEIGRIVQTQSTQDFLAA